MVAIVIVSHSLRLAQGIEELALQMSGGDVPLAIAAGIDDPQNPIGTDAIAIMSAIESVWSPDGVLVLMDMGSALLSTEMALELLSEEQRSAIYLLAAPVVEGAMSAVTSAAAGLSVTEIIAEVDLALCAKQQQLMPSSTAGEVIPAISPVNHCDEWQTFCWTIRNPHGIHARPAASILKVSAQYSANIIVIKGDKRASTRSLNELAMLGVRCGDEIIFQAEGTDASDALKAIETLAKNHFGEAHLLASSEIPLTETPVVSAPVDGAISGLSVQNGIAIGPVKWFTCERPEITQRTVDSPQEELSRIESAIDIVVCELADKAAGPEGDIFAAHKMMLEDPEITRQLQQRLAKGKQAEFAWLEVMQALAEQYCQAETLYLREREADIRDLTRQVLNQLCGVSEQHFITTAPCILLANDLLPSQITSLNKAHILGICLHNGGTTSHTAILARAMGIPAIAKAAITPQNVRDNDTVILDGETGRLWLQPDEVTRLDLLQRAEAWRQQRDRQLADAMLPAVTQGGRNISVLRILVICKTLMPHYLTALRAWVYCVPSFYSMSLQHYPMKKSSFACIVLSPEFLATNQSRSGLWTLVVINRYLHTLYPQRTTPSWDFEVSGCVWRIHKYLFLNCAHLSGPGKNTQRCKLCCRWFQRSRRSGPSKH